MGQDLDPYQKNQKDWLSFLFQFFFKFSEKVNLNFSLLIVNS